MQIVITLLILGSGVMLLAGQLMILAAAFRQSVGWGIAFLLIPFAQLLFICRYWGEAKKGFLLSFLGGLTLFCLTSTLALPQRNALQDLQKAMEGNNPASIRKEIDDLTEQIRLKREGIASLEAEYNQTVATLSRQYQDITAKRQTLDANNATAVTQFNEEAALYHQTNDKIKQLTETLSAARRELDDLLHRRSKHQAAAAPIRKNIVMYTSSHCGTCKIAKQYFDRKGIAFQEIDIDTSAAAQARFQQAGGNGVPLIFVGDQRFEGFNEAAIEQALRSSPPL